MPSMGGSATLISAPRYGDLINVDTTGQADHQVFAWDATAGTYKPLVGVVGDGAGGWHVAHGATFGDPAAATGEDALVVQGGLFVFESPGNQVNVDEVLGVRQTAPLAGDSGLPAVWIARNGDLNGHEYQQPVSLIEDDTDSTAPLLRVDKKGVALLLLGGTAAPGLNLAHGLGLFATTPPAVQPAIVGALSTVADAPAKAVLTSIIAALVGCGLASDGTT